MPHEDADLLCPVPAGPAVAGNIEASTPLPAPFTAASPRLKVAHAFKVYIPEVDGGIPQVMRLCSTGLTGPCDSHVLVARVQGPAQSDIVEGIQVRRAGALASVWSMPLAPSYPWRFWQAARRADVVHYHAPFPLVDLAASLWFPRRTALVVHWHSEIVAQRRMLPIVGPFIRRTLARADRIIVATPALIEQSPFLKPFADKCAVIPYGIEVGYWTGLSDAEHGRIAELRTSHPRAIVATGRLVPYKGFNVLIEAMRHVDAELFIIGTGPLEASLREQAEAAGIARRIHLVGYLDRSELKCRLHACRIFAMPSVEESETFGIAQVEAMACAKPIVNTRLLTGVPWVARDGIEARTVQPGNPAELAVALNHLLNDEAEAAALGARGRERAEKLLNVDAFLQQVLNLYRKAAQARQNR